MGGVIFVHREVSCLYSARTKLSSVQTTYLLLKIYTLGGKKFVHCQDKAQQWNGRGGRSQEGVRGGGRGGTRGVVGGWKYK